MEKLKILMFTTFLFTSELFVYGYHKRLADAEPKVKKKGIVFYEGSFKQALFKAKTEGKMVFIDSYTTWCRPCIKLNTQIFVNEALGKFMNENFVCIKVNIEKGEGPFIKRKYPHYTFPTLLYIRNNGNLKNRFVGIPTYGAIELLNFAKLVINSY